MRLREGGFPITGARAIAGRKEGKRVTEHRHASGNPVGELYWESGHLITVLTGFQGQTTKCIRQGKT